MTDSSSSSKQKEGEEKGGRDCEHPHCRLDRFFLFQSRCAECQKRRCWHASKQHWVRSLLEKQSVCTTCYEQVLQGSVNNLRDVLVVGPLNGLAHKLRDVLQRDKLRTVRFLHPKEDTAPPGTDEGKGKDKRKDEEGEEEYWSADFSDLAEVAEIKKLITTKARRLDAVILNCDAITGEGKEDRHRPTTSGEEATEEEAEQLVEPTAAQQGISPVLIRNGLSYSVAACSLLELLRASDGRLVSVCPNPASWRNWWPFNVPILNVDDFSQINDKEAIDQSRLGIYALSHILGFNERNMTVSVVDPKRHRIQDCICAINKKDDPFENCWETVLFLTASDVTKGRSCCFLHDGKPAGWFMKMAKCEQFRRQVQQEYEKYADPTAQAAGDSQSTSSSIS